MNKKKIKEEKEGDKVKQPAWPSVEEQLTESKVTKGSALEKLIKDNQDFSLLRPAEAHDDVGLPLWLRVYWRKKHPDEKYSKIDPYGAYPEGLHRLYAWMLSHHDLPAQSLKPSGGGGTS